MHLTAPFSSLYQEKIFQGQFPLGLNHQPTLRENRFLDHKNQAIKSSIQTSITKQITSCCLHNKNRMDTCWFTENCCALTPEELNLL